MTWCSQLVKTHRESRKACVAHDHSRKARSKQASALDYAPAEAQSEMILRPKVNGLYQSVSTLV